MKNEDILTWLTKFGMDWVSLHKVYEVFEADVFWSNLDSWHDGAYITKRINTHAYERDEPYIEQYKLNKKALRQLEEAT